MDGQLPAGNEGRKPSTAPWSRLREIGLTISLSSARRQKALKGGVSSIDQGADGEALLNKGGDPAGRLLRTRVSSIFTASVCES